MFLLTAPQLEEAVSRGQGDGYLSIANFRRKMLQHSAYYFTLGREYEVQVGGTWERRKLTDQEPRLALGPREYVIVRSHETFALGDKLMGVIGQVSDFVRLGLELSYGPFIDPLFRGQLELGLWNRLEREAVVRLGQPIGKVSFFDVRDSSPIATIPGSLLERKFQARIPLRDDDPVPSDDTEEDDGLSQPKPWQPKG